MCYLFPLQYVKNALHLNAFLSLLLLLLLYCVFSERKAFGRFYYRFPNGEAGFDVYSRVTSFISTVGCCRGDVARS